MIVAAVQSCSVAGAVAVNATAHARLVDAAAGLGAVLAVFPELSLTGYELDGIGDPGFDVPPDDPRVEPLREACRARGVVAVAGAPVPVGRGRRALSALLFDVDGSVTTYAKMHLHGAEIERFVPGTRQRLLTVDGIEVGLAVCADFGDPAHAADAATLGARVYAVGALVSRAGYRGDAERLAELAAANRMPVVLANHGAPTGGWDPAGCSAIWDGQGRLLAQAPGEGDHLVVVDVAPRGDQLAG